jgi:hypothetical protein
VRNKGHSPLESITLTGGALSITLHVHARRECLEASVKDTSSVDASARIVPLGDGTLASLISEELGVRTRDLAFEQALVAAREIQA